jgi:hypothetical protein
MRRAGYGLEYGIAAAGLPIMAEVKQESTYLAYRLVRS